MIYLFVALWRPCHCTFHNSKMKTRIPYPITPARIDYHKSATIRLSHIMTAGVVLPAVASLAYIIARIIFSIP